MYKVAAISGDGIGPEIIVEGKKVLEAAGERFNFEISWTDFDIGAERYLATKDLLTEEDLAELRKFKAIYFGAIGDPRVQPGILEKGILLAIRFSFDQYVNLRPIKLLEGVETPLSNKTPKDIDFVVVRENTEDFYVGIGSRFKKHQKIDLEVIRNLYNVKFGLDVESDAEEIAYQIGVVTGKEPDGSRPMPLNWQRNAEKNSPPSTRQMFSRMCTDSGVMCSMKRRQLSRCYNRIQLRGCHYDVVCEKPRMVRCCRHSQYVR